MKELMQRLREASLKAITEAQNMDLLETLRVKYLGKKGELTAILRQMGQLSAQERPSMGQLANQLRSDIENAIEARKTELSAALLEKKLRDEALDVTAHPFPAIPRIVRHRRHVLHVLRVVRVAAVEEHRRPVREDEERLLADSRMDKVDVELARPPARVSLANGVSRQPPAKSWQ